MSCRWLCTKAANRQQPNAFLNVLLKHTHTNQPTSRAYKVNINRKSVLHRIWCFAENFFFTFSSVVVDFFHVKNLIHNVFRDKMGAIQIIFTRRYSLQSPLFFFLYAPCIFPCIPSAYKMHWSLFVCCMCFAFGHSTHKSLTIKRTFKNGMFPNEIIRLVPNEKLSVGSYSTINGAFTIVSIINRASERALYKHWCAWQFVLCHLIRLHIDTIQNIFSYIADAGRECIRKGSVNCM